MIEKLILILNIYYKTLIRKDKVLKDLQFTLQIYTLHVSNYTFCHTVTRMATILIFLCIEFFILCVPFLNFALWPLLYKYNFGLANWTLIYQNCAKIIQDHEMRILTQRSIMTKIILTLS